MDSRVNDVMPGEVVTVPETAEHRDIVRVMRRRRVSAFPALDAAGYVLGVVSEADLPPKELGPEPFTGPVRSLLASGRRGERAKAAARHVEGVVGLRDRVSYPPEGSPKSQRSSDGGIWNGPSPAQAGASGAARRPMRER